MAIHRTRIARIRQAAKVKNLPDADHGLTGRGLRGFFRMACQKSRPIANAFVTALVPPATTSSEIRVIGVPSSVIRDPRPKPVIRVP